MKEKLVKYAQVILNTCLKVENNQPLFISANLERLDFVRILANEAYKIGVKDIFFDLSDSNLKHDALKNLTLDELKMSSMWNKNDWNKYAVKGGAFVMLASETPGLMNDIDPKLISDISMYALETRKEFDDLRDKSMVPWCIAAIPTESWARQVFPKSLTPVEDMWNKIFEICGINEDTENLWNEKISKLTERTKKLNELKLKELHYKNDLGTDFTICLNVKHLWASGKELLANGKEVLVNFPTEEVFTSPDCKTANGIVYSSKPLSYQGVIIDNFWIEFKDGIAINSGAKKGAETLSQLIASCEGSNMLGEVALVPYDSPISNANIIFYETLFDENAACHLALGASFPECIENGPSMTIEELKNENMNQSKNHVDFMIGTKDLSIVGITAKGEEIKIFENGNFIDM